jgi:hypothetical protein
MKFVRLFSLAALAAASLLLIGAESKAALITLPNTANNLQGNSFVVGNTGFNFALVLPTGSITPASLASVAVLPLSPVGTTQGGAVAPFGFELAGAGIADGPGGDNGDLLLNFTVTSPVPITAVVLTVTGGGFGGGFGLVTENVFNPVTGALIGSATISNGSVTIALSQALTTINIIKDIFVSGGPSGGFSYSDIQQTFIPIPEPTSVVMLGCGLVGVIGLGLRRVKMA